MTANTNKAICSNFLHNIAYLLKKINIFQELVEKISNTDML